eukprot:3719204-Rhodomonas_salina.2
MRSVDCMRSCEDVDVQTKTQTQTQTTLVRRVDACEANEPPVCGDTVGCVVKANAWSTQMGTRSNTDGHVVNTDGHVVNTDGHAVKHRWAR